MVTEFSWLSYYQVGGNLSTDSPTYVTREADKQLYEALKVGHFCYVLNSRQMGKSSLAFRVKEQLENERFFCIDIDLSGIGQADEIQWYSSVANRLVKEFRPYVKIKFRKWREEYDFLSPVEQLNQLIETVLLPAVPKDKNIVIFLDEIDYVRSLNFSTDQFFILIRSFYNQRSKNKDFNRLNFCLIGVATPSDLIKDKEITPFNIGSAISLKGFTIDEVEPLIQGLKHLVNDPKKVMEDILYWTGGQPFLTQRLCDLVVTSKQVEPNLTELVQENIIDNWDDAEQDKQEHLRTIRNRVLSDERRGSLLLELYRDVLQKGQVTVMNTKEERDLQLSGLVVKRGNILQVYNPIYAKVFNENWINTELRKLRPYSEHYRAWVLSGKKDESRLLVGQALIEAEKWATDKNLGGEDRDFLGASWAKQRDIEREKKDKEAAEERNILLVKANKNLQDANKKAQKRIRLGSIVLAVSLLGAIICGVLAFREGVKATQAKTEIETVKQLVKLAGNLQDKGLSAESNEALKQAGLSFKVENHSLKQALLLAAKATANESLKNTDKANEMIKKSRQYLQQNSSDEEVAKQIVVFVHATEAGLNKEQNSFNLYQTAFKALHDSNYNPYQSSLTIVSEEMVANIHHQLIESLNDEPLAKTVENSLKIHYQERTQHYIMQLENLLKDKNWKAADGKTWDAIFYSAKTKNIDQRTWDWNDTSCQDFKRIDNLWYNQSGGKFGFKVQWSIYKKLNQGSPKYNYDTYVKWAEQVGWIDPKTGWKSYSDLNWSEDSAQDPSIPEGHLPGGFSLTPSDSSLYYGGWEDLWSRIVKEKLRGLGGSIQKKLHIRNLSQLLVNCSI